MRINRNNSVVSLLSERHGGKTVRNFREKFLRKLEGHWRKFQRVLRSEKHSSISLLFTFFLSRTRRVSISECPQRENSETSDSESFRENLRGRFQKKAF